MDDSLDDEAAYRVKVTEYGRGAQSLAGLPLTEPAFWRHVFRLAARPGRSSEKAPFIGAAAESLLRQKLPREAMAIREAAALRLLSDQNARVRKVANEHLAESGKAEATPELRRAALGPDKELAAQAVRILGQRGSEEAYEVLADVLARSSDMRSTIAAEKLIEAGAGAIPSLEALLTRADRLVRWKAVSCLAAIHRKEALGPLLKAFQDESVDVAWLAADGLLALGPAVRRDVLRSVLERPMRIATARALRHYAEHASPNRVFGEIVAATHGLASLAAIPVAIEHALVALDHEPQD
jgi:HEAT repeat protein